MRLVTLFTLAALGLVIYNVDPERSGIIGKLLFYSVLFFSLSGIFNLFLLWVRKKTIGFDAAYSNLGLSFRQGILLSLMVTVILILQGLRMLVWWDALLVVAAVFLVELYFISKS